MSSEIAVRSALLTRAFLSFSWLTMASFKRWIGSKVGSSVVALYMVSSEVVVSDAISYTVEFSM